MAWTTLDKGGTSGYVDDPLVGDTFNGVDDTVIVVAVVSWDTGITACTGWGLTWSQISSSVAVGSKYVDVFAAIVTGSPGSGQAQLTSAGSTSFDALVCEISGADVSGTVAAIFNQTISETTYSGGTANPIGTGFPSAFASATNATLTVQASTQTTQTFSAQTGFTSIAEQSGTRGAIELFIKTTEEADPEYSPVNASQDDLGLAYELLEAAAAGAEPLSAFHTEDQRSVKSRHV